jgi:hypothetical protein
MFQVWPVDTLSSAMQAGDLYSHGLCTKMMIWNFAIFACTTDIFSLSLDIKPNPIQTWTI